MLQARLADVASRARSYKLSKRAEPLLAVVKTAEGLAESAAKQNAPVFALTQLESSVQLAERLDKLCHGVCIFLPRVCGKRCYYSFCQHLFIHAVNTFAGVAHS
jgi:hypothetical protein